TQAGQEYVITVSDFLMIPVQVDTSAFSDANAARGRAVHAASQAPPVDILANDDIVAENLRYGQATDSRLGVPGTYDVKLNQTGTPPTALDMPGVVVGAGNIYTWVIIGKPGSSEHPLTIVTVTSTPAF